MMALVQRRVVVLVFFGQRRLTSGVNPSLSSVSRAAPAKSAVISAPLDRAPPETLHAAASGAKLALSPTPARSCGVTRQRVRSLYPIFQGFNRIACAPAS